MDVTEVQKTPTSLPEIKERFTSFFNQDDNHKRSSKLLMTYGRNLNDKVYYTLSQLTSHVACDESFQEYIKTYTNSKETTLETN